jgi:aryl-alcohol dehydrogenase-like predicted oxidoreductase
MKTVSLGASGLKVSEMCLGALTFGMPGFGCDETESQKIVDTFLDAGGNFFDTSDSYASGRSEEILGRVLRKRRADVVIGTKFGHKTGEGPNDRGSSRQHVLAALDASLRRLGTDYVDLYQVHYYDDSTPIEETLDVLTDCVHAGKVRYIGCCNFYSWQIADANKSAGYRRASEFISCQIIYNLVKRDAENRYFKFAETHGLSLLGYSPLQSGILAGIVERGRPFPSNTRVAASEMHRNVYMSDEERVWRVIDAVRASAARANVPMSVLALAWVIRQPAISSVLIGAQSANQLVENLGALDVEIDPEIWFALDQATTLPSSYPNDFYERLQIREGLD